MKVVLDTSILLAALRSPSGGSNRVLQLALEGRSRLLFCPLVFEYEAILTREEHLVASASSLEQMSLVLDSMVAIAEPVRLAFQWRLMLSDPEDDMVFETAMNGAAEVLVTLNLRDFRGIPTLFNIDVLTPEQLLERMESDEKNHP